MSKDKSVSLGARLLDVVIEGIPPSVNEAYRYCKKNVILTRKAREWRVWAAYRIRNYCLRNKQYSKYQGKVRFIVSFVFPDNRRHDLDNLMKIPQDALMDGGVLKDDSQIIELSAHKIICPDVKGTDGMTRLELVITDEPKITDKWWECDLELL